MEENTPPVPETEKNQTPVSPPTPAPVVEKKKKKISTKWILIIIAIVIVILVPVVIYFVKDCEINKLKEQQQKEIAGIRKQAADAVDQNNETNLKSVAKVFSWAVRTEMTRGNMDLVNQMIIELVKINDYRQVVLLSDQGEVLLSTDKKFEGEGFSASIYEQLLGSDDVKVAPQKNGELMVSAPVFGMDKRLGTIIITYQPSKLEFNDIPVNDK